MNLLDVTNVGFLDELIEQWRSDPQSVAPEWRHLFEAAESGDEAPAGVSEFATRAAALSADQGTTNGRLLTVVQNGAAQHHGMTFIGRPAGPALGSSGDKQAKVDSLLWAYRDIGALYANTNPLGAYETPEMRYMRITVQGVAEGLRLDAHGLTEADLDTEFYAGGFFEPERMPLRDILDRARRTYMSTMGVEFLHIKNRVMRRWLLSKLEQKQYQYLWSPERKQRFQKDLIKAEEFEHFVHANFIGQKRFSLEGGEALIPAVHYLIYNAAQHGLKEIVLGMAHRGRLNVFTNALRKPAVETFSKFIDADQPHEFGGTGDVKYHLGHSFDYQDRETGSTIHISLVANPSHLEAVDPVVQGKARGIQRRRGDINRKRVMPVLIHGDAAFSGQGVVAETFNLSQLKGYRTGGTIHIIVNNQIGFTTASRDARSTLFATDIAKGLQVPIFHVNGDDPEAVVRAIDLAMRWRQKFGYDAVVDIVCYRRLGHNEADEPSYTHPIMYKMIRNHPSAPNVYGRRIDADGIWPDADQEAFRRRYRGVLKEQLELAKSERYQLNMDDSFESGEWTQYQRKFSFERCDTTVSMTELRRVGDALTTIPDGFSLHPKLQRLVKDRRGMLETGKGVDWGFAEALAMGTLLAEGTPIRLSGEDSGRGTFSHRHAEWWDVQAEKPKLYTPLAHVRAGQGSFSVYDSPLSEFGVLGFEYGYSIAQPNILVMWEAQFGDFVNGAQVIIDQFVSSSESKWFRNSGLVMLLPHGYEGQGPEHSSAFLERFLQLCADDNMQVVNVTSPAQVFHLLRRQIHQSFRKPLIVMSPKSLLRHKQAVSTIDELAAGGFRPVLPDDKNVTDVQTLLFCSGKVYYDIAARRERLRRNDIAVVRIEQLYPWPVEQLKMVYTSYPQVDRVVWVQEESRNRGAWKFVRHRIAELTGRAGIEYAGRIKSPSPATGSHSEHVLQLEALLDVAFGKE